MPGVGRTLSLVTLMASIVVFLAVFASAGLAGAQESTPKIAGFPSDLVWHNAPAAWDAKGESLTIAAGKKTDWFVWPGGGYTADSSPRLMFKAGNDFIFSTNVEVEPHKTYDAGCIALYAGPSHWAKLCLEAQDDGRLDVISVVTRGRSDDATSFAARGRSIYLKVANADGVTFFYASEDGKTWTIVRKFNLESNEALQAGFSAQSPDGEGARATFTDFEYRPGKVNLWQVH